MVLRITLTLNTLRFIVLQNLNCYIDKKNYTLLTLYSFYTIIYMGEMLSGRGMMISYIPTITLHIHITTF